MLMPMVTDSIAIVRYGTEDIKNMQLTYAQMSVYAGISCCSCEILVFPIWDMLVCSRISVFFGKAEVYYVHKVTFFAKSHEKIIRFHIPMNEVF